MLETYVTIAITDYPVQVFYIYKLEVGKKIF